ncbi:hypothetical protein [Terasakiella sp. SH-1]|uniref:hypothetical protein n=1 Tax=Terasakiella sp. SH-1 TaxID=2560057 RepID=UPI0014314CF0|nr:hypothetical protein [Terasakiella sp. SH-1]
MDPQMVWDMMDESEAEVDTHTTLCQSIEPEVERESFEEKSARKVSAGWMGFPMYGLNR